MPDVLARASRTGIPLYAAFCVLWSMPCPAAAQTARPDPTALVNRAASLVVSCAYGVQARQEKNGVVKVAELSDRERAMQSKVSLTALLRPGRYAYTGIWSERASGVDVWTVAFAPAASGQPAARPGEDVRINQAMNNLTGTMQIDRATGGFVHVQAWLQGKMFFADVVTRFGVPAPVTVTILSANLTIDQRLAGHTWLPDRAMLDVWAFASWWFLASPIHYSYPVAFMCEKK
jgi:hypothetical protein